MRILITLFISSVLLASCVSSKKYKETVGKLEQEHAARVDSLGVKLSNLEDERERLTIKLAESRGANQALLATQDKLQDRIDQLQAEIENIGSKASNQQQSLNSKLTERESEIDALELRLAQIKGLMSSWENAPKAVAQEIGLALEPFDSTLYMVDHRGGETIVVLNEDLLFSPGSTSRLKQPGIDAIQAVSGILGKYPSLYIQVIGHTDNRPVARKSLDNWDYSLLRAGNIAKLLIDEFDLGANRILPAGKSEYAPRTSNETPEGQSANRRIELILSGSSSDLAREIKREMNK